MFEKFPSIEQYRQVVQKISDKFQYAGKDENGNVMYNFNKPLPVITFTQTVKIHGTNGGVILLRDGTIRTQSRNRILSPESDNNGFDKFVSERIDCWKNISKQIFSAFGFMDKFIVYGEFAGENIQKNVAVSETPKSFYVFSVMGFSGGYRVEQLGLLNSGLFELPEFNIYSIRQFQLGKIIIDFNYADEYIPRLQETALAIEAECPVGKFHGVSGIGEGAVFTAYYNGETYRFKVKGEKHSASRVKLLPTVDSVMIKDVREFVEQTVTENRLQQGIDYMNEMQIATDIKHLGDFLRWVVADVHKEESDIIKSKNFEVKLVNQEISKRAKRYYLDRFGV